MDETYYQIRVQSHLGPSSAGMFEGFTIRHETNGETVLTGPVADQAAPHGVLMRIRDLGLTLVEVKSLKSDFKS